MQKFLLKYYYIMGGNRVGNVRAECLKVSVEAGEMNLAPDKSHILLDANSLNCVTEIVDGANCKGHLTICKMS